MSTTVVIACNIERNTAAVELGLDASWNSIARKIGATGATSVKPCTNLNMSSTRIKRHTRCFQQHAHL